MTMPSSPTPYEPHQLEQILSLLHDQSTCLTLKTTMLELGVPRFVARRLLEDVVAQLAESVTEGRGRRCRYEVVRLVPRWTRVDGENSNGVKKSFMELVIGDLHCGNGNGHDNDGAEKGSLFSIAPILSNEAVEDADDDDEVDDDGNPICNTNNDDDDDDTAKSCLGVLSAAHEKALACQRDKLMEGNEAELFSIFNVTGDGGIHTPDEQQRSTIHGNYILPAPELCEENDHGERVVIRRVKRGRDLFSVPAAPTSSSGNKTTTTTTRFGGSRGGGGKKIASEATTTPPVPLAKNPPKQKVTTAAAFFGTANNKKKDSSKKEKRNEDEEDAVPKKSGNSKQNNTNKDSNEDSNNQESNKGNADDFIGDVDEDDEFVQEEAARKQRNAHKARKEARAQIMDDQAKKRNMGSVKGRRSCVAPEKRRKKMDHEEDHEEDGVKGGAVGAGDGDGDEKMEEEEEKEDGADEKVGAMDAFTKKNASAASSSSSNNNNNNNNNNSGGSKKRRKKLVEQTTVNDAGYMVTETVTVWEDVSDDDANDGEKSKEETNKPKQSLSAKASGQSTTAKKSGSNSGGATKKKQAGLMGFFAKKK